MVFVCPNIHCGKVFPTVRAVSNHARSRKCRDAKAEAATSTKRRCPENEQESANPQAQTMDKRRRLENESDSGEGADNQPEGFAILEVSILFHNPIDMNWFLLHFRGPQHLK